MTSVRGLAIDSTAIPVVGASYRVNRNLIAEDAMSIAGEPTLYGGFYSVQGDFSAAYRPQILNTYIESGLLGKTGGGVSTAFSHYEFTLGDQYNKSWTFGSCALMSCEISLKPNQISQCNFEWVGTYKKLTDTAIGSPDYTKEPSMFYNAYISGIKCRGLTFRIERPIAPDDYVLGSEYTQSLMQSENLTIGGTINLGNAEYQMLDETLYTEDEASWDNTNPKNNTTYFGDLTIKFRNPSGSTDLCEIYLDEIHMQDLTVSVEGQRRFDKTVEWRAITTDSSGVLFTTAI